MNGTQTGQRTAVAEMIADAKRYRDSAGIVNAGLDAQYERVCVRGDFAGLVDGETSDRSAGPVAVAVKRGGTGAVATEFRYERPGTGGGGTSNYRPANAASEKQMSFINSLLAQIPTDVADKAEEWLSGRTLNVREASDTIQRLLKHKDNAARHNLPTRNNLHSTSREDESVPTAPVAAPEETTVNPWSEWRTVAQSLAPETDGMYRYAVTAVSTGETAFYGISRRTDKRTGRVYLNLCHVIGGRADTRITNPAIMITVAKQIHAAGIDAARKRFADELGMCWHCGRHLTDATSRSLGMGPVCRNK